MKKTTALRRLIERKQATLLCGVQDGLSAKLAEGAGFDVLWASGFCISATKCLPDVGLVTMTEHLAATAEINRASTLPVVADVDDGFGDAVNVTRMIREYEAAGVAGVCIEDNTHPKRNSLFSELDRKLVSTAAFAGKIRAAKAAQQDPDFVVIARTEAMVADMGVDEALQRANAYADAGADWVLPHSKEKDPANLFSFSAQWKGRLPLVSVPSRYPQVSADELYAKGFPVVIFANHGMRAMVTAMEQVFAKLVQARSLNAVEGDIATLQDIFKLVDFDQVGEIEARFLGGPAGVAKDKDNAAS